MFDRKPKRNLKPKFVLNRRSNQIDFYKLQITICICQIDAQFLGVLYTYETYKFLSLYFFFRWQTRSLRKMGYQAKPRYSIQIWIPHTNQNETSMLKTISMDNIFLFFKFWLEFGKSNIRKGVLLDIISACNCIYTELCGAFQIQKCKQTIIIAIIYTSAYIALPYILFLPRRNGKGYVHLHFANGCCSHCLRFLSISSVPFIASLLNAF